MSETPLLVVDRLVKEYRLGLLKARTSFRLEADFTIAEPAIVGMMGPNGSGKTTLFELLERIPLGRIADPKDVVGPALFFASPAADFVTGQILYVDGGITASQ